MLLIKRSLRKSERTLALHLHALNDSKLISVCADFLFSFRREAGGQAEGPAQHLRPVKPQCCGSMVPREMPK
jgi:hypothetical protein